MEKLKQLIKIIQDASEKIDALGIDLGAYNPLDASGMSIGFEYFITVGFNDIKVSNRTCEIYPYRVDAYIGNFRVHAIASEEEYLEAFPEAMEDKIKALENQLAKLKGEE